MNKLLRKIMGLLPAGLLLLFALNGCSESTAVQKSTRADLINLVETAHISNPTRNAVKFPHDIHVEFASKNGEECRTCHEYNDHGDLVYTFKRSTPMSEDELVKHYHDPCQACHTEANAFVEYKAPLLCGSCHDEPRRYESNWTPIGFDKSLHYLHTMVTDDDCASCHHVYDSVAGELVYIEGEESSCIICHKSTAQNGTPSIKSASHRACITCHSENSCSDCHDPIRQAKIEKMDDTPRLERGQPDFALLSAGDRDLRRSKLGTVPFSHIEHEEALGTCRTCHHEGFEPCQNCHTPGGSKLAQGVTLQQAMHAMNSPHSCVGCHDREKSEPGCSGCHGLMEQGRLSEHSCTICHNGPKPSELNAVKGRFTSFDQFRADTNKTRLSFAAKEIPEIVEVSALQDRYQPVKFPHKRIVDTLMAIISGSRIATYFHGDEDVVCQGCHHQSPIGESPPLCENCHGEPFNPNTKNKPGLLGAYHRQCTGCHEKMNVLGRGNDCTVCHEDKGMQADAGTSVERPKEK